MFRKETSGETVLAIRGTEGDFNSLEELSKDLKSDLAEIGFIGFALAQSISMINFILRLSAPISDSDVLQLKAEFSKSELPNSIPLPDSDKFLNIQPTTPKSGLGLISPGQKITVTGHSLGGHLAAFAARLFPGLISEAYVYNAPGFDPDFSSELLGAGAGAVTALLTGSPILSLIVGALTNAKGTEMKLTEPFVEHLRGFLPQAPAASFSDITLHVLNSEDLAPGNDADLITSILSNQQGLGTPTSITTEANSHIIEPFMDSLALQSLISTLNPQLPLDDITGLYQTASNQANRSEESLLEALAKLLANDHDSLPTADAGANLVGSFKTGKATLEARQGFYEKLIPLEQLIAGKPQLRIFPIAGLSNQEWVTNAESNLAYRYALDNLNPFVITGDDSIYAQHNTGGKLDADNYSSSYLADRAQLLRHKIELNTADLGAIQFAGEFIQYTDHLNDYALEQRKAEFPANPGEEVRQYIFGSERPEILSGQSRDDRVYGRGGRDVLLGNLGEDYLEGGRGADQLYGYRFDIDADDRVPDTLAGGEGRDIYITGAGDIVIDADGDGRVLFQGRLLTSAQRESGQPSYLSGDGEFRYRLDGTDLVVTALESQHADEMRIRDFHIRPEGFLGITLDDTSAPGQEVVLEGTEDKDTLAASAITTRVLAHGAADAITYPGASVPGLEILAGSGDDTVQPVQIGADINTDVSTPGGVIIRGEDGSDILQGAQRDDKLFGGQGHDTLLGHGGNDTLIVISGNNWLSGGGGDDDLADGPGNDFLLGGSARDFLIARGGDDILYGDAGGLGGIWDGEQQKIIPLDPGLGGDFAIIEEASNAGDDLLMGGAGDDRIYAGAGDDSASGGAGRDQIEGEGGDDSLSGDAGDDILWGDINPATFDSDGRILAQGTSAPGNAPYTLRWRRVLDPVDIAGNDQLSGGPGNDSLYGGLGNDTYNGGADSDVLTDTGGDDVYLYSSGWGFDVINDTLGNDRLEFDAGIDADTLVIRRAGPDLSIFDPAGQNQLLIQGWFESPDHQIETLHLAGGASLDAAALSAAATAPPPGTGGDDHIEGRIGTNNSLIGGAGDDTLIGKDGDDFLDGGADNDVLSGGAGNDLLAGGPGADTYRPGGGHDVIEDDAGDAQVNTVELPAGVGFADLDATTSGDDLLLSWAGGASSATIEDYALQPQSWRLQFASTQPFSLDDITHPQTGDAAIARRAATGFEQYLYAELSATLDARINGSLGIDGLKSWAIQIINNQAPLPPRVVPVDTPKGFYSPTYPGLYANGLSWRFAGATPPPVLDGEISIVTTTGSNGDDGLALSGFDSAPAFSSETRFTDLELVLDPDIILATGSNASGSITSVTRRVREVLEADDPPPPWPGGSGLIVSPARVEFGTWAIERINTLGGDDFIDRNDAFLDQRAPAIIHAGSGNDRITGGPRDVFIDGGAGADILSGGAGLNLILGGAGDDVLSVPGDHFQTYHILNGMSGDDVLSSPGRAILQGGPGRDRLDASGNARFVDVPGNLDGSLLDGGDQDDTLLDSAWSDFLSGGRGDDDLTITAGHDVLAFNRGDGNDRLRFASPVLTGDTCGGECTQAPLQPTQLTLSLGGGIRQEHLRLGREGADLLVYTGEDESLRIAGWYDQSPDPLSFFSTPIGKLQIIAAAREDFAPGGFSPFAGQPLYRYDFNHIVTAFDQARQANPASPEFSLSGWSIAASLAGAAIIDSPDRAVGADLAYQYGLRGNLAGLGSASVEGIIENNQFGRAPQALRRLDAGNGGLGGGLMRLTGAGAAAESQIQYTAVSGTAADDILTGAAGSDRLLGFAGNDTLRAGDGADELRGGAGDDLLEGGFGDDRYVIDAAASAGNDRILDTGGNDRLVIDNLGPGNPLTVTRLGVDLDLRLGLAGGVRLPGWFSSPGRRIEEFYLGGPLLTAPAIEALADFPGNLAPQLQQPVTAQEAVQGEAFSLDVSAETFSDPNPFDAPVLRAGDAATGVLPAWLHFDPESGRFSGTPADVDVGTREIEITGTDFGGLSASTVFSLTVRPGIANPPRIEAAPADILGLPLHPFEYRLPRELFVFPGSEPVSFALTRADGAALPEWLNFDPATLLLSGLPATPEKLDLRISASTNAASLSAGFKLDITDGSGFAVFDGGPGKESGLGIDGVRNAMFGNGGNDFLSAPDGDDFLRLGNDGGSANDGGGRDVLIGGRGDDHLSLSRGDDYADGQAGDDNLGGGAGDDVLIGGPGNDTLSDEGANGSSVDFVPLGSEADPGVGDVIDNGEGEFFRKVEVVKSSADRLFGGAGDDRLLAGPGDDRLFAGPGNDVLFGDAGNDLYHGGSGDDRYRFDLSQAQGRNLISDPSGNDTLLFEFADPADLAVGRDGSSLVLEFSPQTAFTLQGWYAGNGNRIETAEFFTASATGATPDFSLDAAALEALVPGAGNRTPELARILAAQQAVEDQAFSFTLPAGLFSDPDGDSLQYSAATSLGTALPAWLSFDPLSRHFQGTPGNLDSGAAGISITATDPFGESVSTTFALTVVNTNDAPTVNAAVPAQQAQQAAPVAFNLAPDLFLDPDPGDTLSITATLGNGQALPGWLAFNAANLSFAGTAPVSVQGSLGLRVTATDSGGLAASTGFQLVVEHNPALHYIPGNNGNDIISGSPADDVISGGSGQDLLSGGGGDDIFVVNGADPAADAFNGGPGFDQILGGIADDTIQLLGFSGEFSVEKIDGGAGTNVIAGSGSSNGIDLSHTTLVNIDHIDLGPGHDSFLGGPGDDRIIGGPGRDTLRGGGGDDSFIVEGAGGDTDLYYGGDGFDQILGGNGDDTVFLHVFDSVAGVERIDGGPGGNTIQGGPGADRLDFSASEILNIQRIDLGGGNDRFTGSSGADRVRGGPGRDTLAGGPGDDSFLIDGDDGSSDSYRGGAGFDQILGGAGDDVLRLRTLVSGDSIEVIDGGAGHNILSGDQYANQIDLSGTQLRNIDAINLGDGGDLLTAGNGDDDISGGPGRDFLWGGGGDDRYRFNRGDGQDTITETSGNDTLAYGPAIAPDQLWFEQRLQDLRITTLGGQDQITVRNWYADPAARIETITTSSGAALIAANVQQLVDAMAAFAPPAPGQTQFTAAAQQALDPVIAAAWQ